MRYLICDQVSLNGLKKFQVFSFKITDRLGPAFQSTLIINYSKTIWFMNKIG